MTTIRWYDIAFATALPVFAALVWLTADQGTAARFFGCGVLAGLGACYLAFGRHAVLVVTSAQRPARREQVAIRAFVVVLIMAAVAAPLCCPVLAVTQTLVIPCVWTIVERLRHTIMLVGVVTVGVFVTMSLSLGATLASTGEAGLIQLLVLVVSLMSGLWINRIGDDATERARLLAELTVAQDQLASTAREAGIAGERERLSRDIHDTIAQSLTSVVMLAQRADAELPAVSQVGPARETIGLIEATAREALVEARSLVSALSPLPQGGHGLHDVLERLGRRSEREGDLRVTTTVASQPIPRDIEVVLLRCAQEGLANVRKHARAHNASVIVTTIDGRAHLTVTDDGRGIAPGDLDGDPGFGIAGMRDRVRQVGGELHVRPADQGTVLTVIIPLPTHKSPVPSPSTRLPSDEPSATG